MRSSLCAAAGLPQTCLKILPLIFLLPGALLPGAAIADPNPAPNVADAARNQDHALIQSLLSRHVDANSRSDDGSTALLWAAHWNDVETAGLLLHAGADANLANDFKMTPLSQACTNASSALVHSLLKGGANPNTPIATGETPLHTCSRTGNAEAVGLLLEFGAQVNATEPTNRQTPLMWAVNEHHPDVVKELIAAHADLNAHSKQGFTALHFAARTGDIENLKLLLAAGMNIDTLTKADPATGGRGGRSGIVNALGFPKSVSNDGYTPLLIATVRGQIPMAEFLLDHGADPNILAAGYTPLHWASGEWESYTANRVYGIVDAMGGIPDRKAKIELVKALLAHGANVNAQMTKPQPSFAGGYVESVGATPFLLAAGSDDLEMMKLLLAAGADPKIRTSTGANAVMAASGLNHFIGETVVTEDQALACVRFLLDLGVDPKGETTFNDNALFGAAYHGWNKLLAELIDLGVNVNAVSRAGVTPWLAASGQGDRLGGVLFNQEGADLLLKHGADPKLGHPCAAQARCRIEDEGTNEARKTP